MCRKFFGDTIVYHKVSIHKGSYLPFGLQDKRVSMAPNGEIYFREAYHADFSTASLEYKHLFIHEMAHVWQYQHKMNVKTRGMFSWAANYTYELHGRSLSGYGMEQQAKIIADYYLITQFSGLRDWERYGKCTNCEDLSDNDLIRKYKYTLGAFPRWK